MKKILIFILSIISAHIAISQENPPKLMIMGVPQYMIRHGVRIDFEIPTKNYRSWWVVSPVYFINVSGLGNEERRDYKRMHGYGLTLGHKVYLSKTFPEQGTYLGGALGYHYYNFVTDLGHWEEIEREGLNYLEYGTSDYHIYVNKLLMDAIIGYQTEITSRLYIDVYAGIGLRYSLHEQPSGSDIKYNDNVFDYGYTGISFVGGIRFGIGI